MASISVAQMPIALGQHHRILTFRNDNGTIFAEMDGGPVGPDGTIIDYGNSKLLDATGAFISGEKPLGVQTTGPDAGTPLFYYPQATAESTIFTGSMSDVKGRYNAAQTAADAINAAGFRYYFLPSETQDGQANSNSVNSTLLQAMGFDLGPVFS